MTTYLYPILLAWSICVLSGCSASSSLIKKVSLPAISGKVTDYITSKPIQGAHVQIAGHPDTTAETNKFGDFTTRPATFLQFNLFSPGHDLTEFRLKAWSKGYFPDQQGHIPTMVDGHLSAGWIPIKPKIKRSAADRRRTIDQFSFLRIGMPLTVVKDRIGWPDETIQGLGGWLYRLADGSEVIIVDQAEKPPHSFEQSRILWFGQSAGDKWLWRKPS